MDFYHTFRKQKILKGGKKVYRWYYWFYNEDKRQIQKACPRCRNRSEADAFVRTLPPPGGGVINPDLLLSVIAEKMYIPGSDHVDRRRQLGQSVKFDTLAEARGYINLIIQEFGCYALKDIDSEDVITYLFKIKRSGSWKNRYLTIFKEIYAEAPRYGCKIRTPPFPSFARNSKKADIFTNAELAALLKPGNFPDDVYFIMFLLILSGGLRLGEARGVRYKQILFDRKILIVDGFCQKNGNRTVYNKCGSPDEPKLRVVWLPDVTIAALAEYTRNKALMPDDFVFLYNGKVVRQETAENVFFRALVSAGIAYSKEKLIDLGYWKKGKIRKKAAAIPGGRKLVPHSLRYTYVSRMRRDLTAAELKPMTGHESEVMVDYYNNVILENAIAALPAADSALENLLTFG
ncbi:tyrosine-type recombinase/integrase [Treponema sp. R80B11-R83G3]